MICSWSKASSISSSSRALKTLMSFASSSAFLVSKSPLAIYATVTVCHSKTENLSDITRSADILIVAIGKKYFVKSDMVKDNAVVIDVGINVEDGKIYGDVDFESVKDKVSHLTPVPNGVGRMTVISLMKNVIKAYLEQSK